MRPLKTTEFFLLLVCGVGCFCIYNIQWFHYYSKFFPKGPVPKPGSHNLTSLHGFAQKIVSLKNAKGKRILSIIAAKPATTANSSGHASNSASQVTEATKHTSKLPEALDTVSIRESPGAGVTVSRPGISTKQLRNFFNYSRSISSKNYFNSNGSSALTGKLIVSQLECKIPEISLWSAESNQSYRIAEPLQCLEGVEGSVPGLTFVNKTTLSINTALLKSAWNLSFDEVHCCYQFIMQVPQNPETFEDVFFYHKILSDFCLPISSPSVVPLSNSIKVTCYHSFKNARTEIHRDYHILANLEPQTSMLHGHDLARKIKHWKNKTDVPVSILIYGLECGNRLNVRRQMPLTVKYLEESGAFEMLGYVKVGPHTSSNVVPALTSFYFDELALTCDYIRGKFIDNCPWIFKKLSDINYVTSFVEDGNIFKTGTDRFLNPPTDFYHIPWMRYVHRHVFTDDYNICMENKTKYQVMIDHMQNFAEIMGTNKLPFFYFSWFTDLSHDNFNGLQGIDGYLRDSLQYLNKSGNLDNTIVIVMGDHGYRWFTIRRSVTGWYEDKQPAMWIKLPPRFSQKYPKIKEALEYNQDKLSSPFDLHETFRHVISLTTGRLPNKVPRGQSLFQKLEDRNCFQAGIPVGYCPCAVLLPFKNADRPFLKNAAVAAITDPTFPVSSLPEDKICTKMTIKSIVAAAALGKNEQSNLDDNELEDLLLAGTPFVLGVITNRPKKVAIEFIIKYEANTKQFKVVYYFGIDSTNVKKIADQGYYHCK